MKAVILAAGLGTRLSSLMPKPLTALVGDKTIMDFQVERLSKVLGMNQIMAVVGHKKEIIMERFPDITYVYNQAYAHTNTAKSLLCALEKLDEDVLWLNGDVFFEPAVVERVMNSETSAVLVNKTTAEDEAIRYSLSPEGNIYELSKQVQPGLGEAPGVNLIKKSDIKAFVHELCNVDPKAYFEKALEKLTLSAEIIVKPIYLRELSCQEIDFAEDLEAVRGHLRQASAR